MLGTLVKILLSVVGLAALVFVGLLVFGTLTDFNPEPLEDAESHAVANQPMDSTFRMMIWNIGYAGLGREQDFFMDGGKNVQPSREENNRYFAGIREFVASQNDVDFLLFQEVDRKAKRSYGEDQAAELATRLPGHNWFYASNFKVRFIPVPFDPFPFVRPIGHVDAGLVTWSKAMPHSAKRYDYPGNYGWPKRIFHLDRCFLETRHKLENGRELVVINSHNSAYDGGVLKAEEMAMLHGHLESEYQKGNYVVVGGDWNQCPPDFDPKTFKKDESEYEQQNIPADYLPGWTWAYDPLTPTNRKVARPYDPASTFTTVIDFYLLSPNIDVLSVQGVPMGFAYSDHQPVVLEARLRL